MLSSDFTYCLRLIKRILGGMHTVMLLRVMNYSFGLTQMALDMKAEIIQSLERATTVWTLVRF